MEVVDNTEQILTRKVNTTTIDHIRVITQQLCIQIMFQREFVNHDGVQNANVAFFLAHPTYFGIIENKVWPPKLGVPNLNHILTYLDQLNQAMLNK